MQLDYPHIMPYGIAVLAVLLVYRRLRRRFGRQAVRPVRMRLRIGILIVLGCSLLPAAIRSSQLLLIDLAGLLTGVGLGIWGARRTRYQRSDGALYYIPHTYSGVAVSLLLVGRLAYRMVMLYSLSRAAGDGTDALQELGSPAMFRNPFTVGLLFLVIGYYVCYYSLVLSKSKRIGPEDLEISATSIATSPNGYGGHSSGR